jgi:hypothetical protein
MSSKMSPTMPLDLKIILAHFKLTSQISQLTSCWALPRVHRVTWVREYGLLWLPTGGVVLQVCVVFACGVGGGHSLIHVSKVLCAVCCGDCLKFCGWLVSRHGASRWHIWGQSFASCDLVQSTWSYIIVPTFYVNFQHCVCLTYSIHYELVFCSTMLAIAVCLERIIFNNCSYYWNLLSKGRPQSTEHQPPASAISPPNQVLVILSPFITSLREASFVPPTPGGIQIEDIQLAVRA